MKNYFVENLISRKNINFASIFMETKHFVLQLAFWQFNICPSVKPVSDACIKLSKNILPNYIIHKYVNFYGLNSRQLKFVSMEFFNSQKSSLIFFKNYFH